MGGLHDMCRTAHSRLVSKDLLLALGVFVVDHLWQNQAKGDLFD